MFLQIKIFLLKLGIRKDVAVSVNKESMKKGALKCISQVSGFYFTAFFSGYLQRRI